MTMDHGTRIGPYEIVAPLGAGGMGEVYRARDTRLGRTVAIKMLPEEFAADADRLGRLEQEARLLAALNHPGIAHLYGFESVPLEGGRLGHLLIMELAEGEDLAERLKRGAIPVDEALGIARQIAEALEEAHENGIIHRDLKPANVKLTPDGKVKVLDFGLAKACARETAPGPADLSHSPTLAHAGTMAGMILGTAAYMSPEQARGKPLDKRADIWSFGVVLFEMLTGRSLFQAETVSDTLAAVLRQEIDWSALPPPVPAEVRRLLARCLERDPRRRLRDIGDARLAMDEATSRATPVAESPARPRWGARPGVWIAVVLVAATALGIWMLRRPPAAGAARLERWALAIPEGMTLSSADAPQIALSRDGLLQVVVVVDRTGTPRLLLRRADEFEPRLLPDTERAIAPFWSPDGAWIGFFRDNALFKLPVTGGPPIRLTTTSGQVRGATWSTDGFIYLTPDTNVPLSRIRDTGGPVEPVTRLDETRDERTHRWPSALPDGSAVLFTCDTQASTEYYDDARIEAVRPATGERKVLVEGASQAWYSPEGHLVFARGGSLFAVRFDPRALAAGTSPVRAVEGVATDVGSGAVQFDVAQSGAALWAPGSPLATYSIVWIDRSLAETVLPLPSAPYNELALSPDGRRLALVGGQGGESDLWVADLGRGGLTRLTFGETVSSPVWTPAGDRLAYATRPPGRKDNLWQIVWRPADGSRDPELLVQAERGPNPSSFSPDSRTLVYDMLSQDAIRRDIWMVRLDGPRRPEAVVSGPFMKTAAVVSPDGRWLAYVSNENGRGSVFVRPFPDGDGRWQISTPNGVEPQWSPSGRELFYRNDTALYRVTVGTSGGFLAGRPERLFDRAASGGNVRTYSPAADGRFLTFRSPEGAASVRRLHLELGFARRLQELAPGD